MKGPKDQGDEQALKIVVAGKGNDRVGEDTPQEEGGEVEKTKKQFNVIMSQV